MSAGKNAIRSMLLSGPGIATARALAPGTVTIVMLHRFVAGDERDDQRHTHTAAELRTMLQTLRARRASIVSLGTLVAPDAHPVPPGAVAFTVDDGYADFAQVGWPIFREFDCPVTVFLTTGFLDRKLWPWWELVLWAFDNTRERRARLSIAGATWERSWGDASARKGAAAALIEHFKTLPNAQREAALAALPEALAVTPPSDIPDVHAPMSWDDVRRAGREGATFGPHTVTHPILSRVTDEQALAEIAGSWDRVRAETDATVPVFCYPNGDPASFGEREQAIVGGQHLALALSAVPGNATRADFVPGARRQYRVPRFACPHEPTALLWLASGWERVRNGSRAE